MGRASQTLNKNIVGLGSNFAVAKFELSCSTDQNFMKRNFGSVSRLEVNEGREEHLFC